MTATRAYLPGDCFTLTPDGVSIHGERLAGIVFTVKAAHGSMYTATQKALRTAVADFEMLPHPGPATPEADTPRSRRKPRTHDYRTPAQKCQAEIYAAIRAHKLDVKTAYVMLSETTEAIGSQIQKQETL